ncbi:MAG: flagellar protein FlaG [Gammaproteobacteria bacterium]|nr:flagellar protein FlaG [Gammaproteobacteria bacterium]
MATDINITVPSSRPAQTPASISTRQNNTQSNSAPAQPTVEKAVSVETKEVASKITEKVENSAEELQEFQERLEEAVSNINEYAQNIERSLQFSISDTDGRTIIKVIDSETNEIVRQIPPEEVLSISERLGSAGNGGLLFQAKV